jgi:hypothetical protein
VREETTRLFLCQNVPSLLNTVTLETSSPCKSFPGLTNEFSCAPDELLALEKLRDEELEEGRGLNSGLPAAVLLRGTKLPQQD